MAQDPFLIRELARHIAQDLRKKGHTGVQVFADAYAALNGNPSRRLIDPNVDLAGVTTSDWILPWKPVSTNLVAMSHSGATEAGK